MFVRIIFLRFVCAVYVYSSGSMLNMHEAGSWTLT